MTKRWKAEISDFTILLIKYNLAHGAEWHVEGKWHVEGRWHAEGKWHVAQ